MKTKLTKKTLTDSMLSKPNEFEAVTQNYGRAEFVVCPIIIRGKIREVYIYPLQQPNAKNYFYVENKDGWNGIHFGTLLLENNKGIDQPCVWKTFYCKEHKCHSFEFYVPKSSKSFSLNNGLGGLWFEWR